MEYSEFIADFARRTLLNLEHVQEEADSGNERVYPVTQLWNSLLGLIVLPKERDIERIPDTALRDLRSAGWPQITTTHGDEHESLREMVRALRNAVAHFNVEFSPGHDGEILTVTVWTEEIRDRRPVRDSRGWEGRISVSNLGDLARRIANLYVKEFATAA
jgi:hypothetical protein